MKKMSIIAIAATVLSANAQAITLEEALVSSYNNNEELKINKSDFLSGVEKFPRALANFMPQIFLSSDIEKFNVDKTSNVGLRDSITRNSTKHTNSIIASQSLFSGWSSVSELKSAQATFRALRSEYYAKEQQALLKDIEKYLECIATKEKHNIAKLSVKSNKTQLRAMQEKFKQGESTATEVASAREGFSTSEAQEAITLANYEAAKSSFIETIGALPENLTMPQVPDDLITDLDELIATAKRKNLSIETVQHQIISAKAESSAAKGQLLPTVDFRIRADKTKYTPQSDANGTVNNKGVTSSLSVRVPILSKGGAEYSDIRRANQAHKKSILSFDSAIKRISSQCTAALSNFEAAKKRLLATKQAVKSAEIAYDGMTQEEQLGSKTIIDVLRAEDRLNNARDGFVDAKKNILFTAYQIKTLTGDLTAKSLKLNVKHFEPEQEFKKLKFKIVGF